MTVAVALPRARSTRERVARELMSGTVARWSDRLQDVARDLLLEEAFGATEDELALLRLHDRSRWRFGVLVYLARRMADEVAFVHQVSAAEAAFEAVGDDPAAGVADAQVAAVWVSLLGLRMPAVTLGGDERERRDFYSRRMRSDWSEGFTELLRDLFLGEGAHATQHELRLLALIPVTEWRLGVLAYVARRSVAEIAFRERMMAAAQVFRSAVPGNPEARKQDTLAELDGLFS